MKSTWSQNYPF